MNAPDAPAAAPATDDIHGVYVVSVRRGLDRRAARTEALAHVGLSAEAVESGTAARIALAEAFTSTGFAAPDVIAMIDWLTLLATEPAQIDGNPYDCFTQRGGVDSEGHATDVWMIALGGQQAPENPLACAEAAHAVWPRLLDLLGASVGGLVFDPEASGTEHRSINLPDTRTPLMLRLKSGWDYDAEGNQIRLPEDEAWRRFVAANRAYTLDGKTRLDTKTMRRMRRHMRKNYIRLGKAG